jgi:hypothetical protein
MTETERKPGADDTYDICLLLEQPLSHTDAQQIVTMHETWDDPVNYHVMMPLDDAAAGIETALGTLAAGDAMAAVPLSVLEEDAERAHEQSVEITDEACTQSVQRLSELGARADFEIVTGDPVERLTQAVGERGSSEVIILTRPHLVAELFHTDWTHQARRRLGVPLLHMLAHGDSI